MSKKLVAILMVSLIAMFLFSGVPAALALEEHGHMHVEIDIKPGSYPNAINTRNNGVVPVALFGSDLFDVADVDLTTVRLSRMEDHEGGAAVRYRPLKM